MLSNEERNRLVKTCEKFPDAVKIAEIYSVSVGSVYRLIRQMKDTGVGGLKNQFQRTQTCSFPGRH